jgi:hypothetical protein
MSSDSVVRLLTEAETAARRSDLLESENRTLSGTVNALQSQEGVVLQRTMLSIVKCVAVATVLAGSFYFSKRVVTVSDWQAFFLVIVIAVSFLLMEGTISEAAVKWRGGSARVKAPPGGASTSGRSSAKGT